MDIKKYKTKKTDGSDFYEISTKSREIIIQREDFKKGNDEPSVYFIDVFDINIKDSSEAYIESLSGNFDELQEALEYLHHHLEIPKNIINKIKGI